MSPTQSASTSTGTYDNNGQYTRKGILRYEKVFGDGYISTGGPETTQYLCAKLGETLKAGARVLDVGSGIGGAAFHLAKQYGASVTGVDLSPEMVAIAGERAQEAGKGIAVKFLLADILEAPFDQPFDIVWSRDALMHLPDKTRLFSRLFDLTAPGGRLVITDYAKGTGPGSAEFRDYVAKTGYHLTDPASYGKLLAAAGYVNVVAEDATDRFVDILKREVERLSANRDDFVKYFSEEDLNYLIERWEMKVGFCRAGDMKWGIYKADRAPVGRASS
jgi:phosphoethanolamine N-methyltransferase